MLREGRGNSCAIRIAKSQRAGTGFDQERIGMSVVAAFEFNNLFSLRVPPRQTNGRHRRFSAGIAHANFLNTGHEGADEFGHRHLQGIRYSKTDPVVGGLLDSLDYFWMGVTEDGGAPGADVIQVFIAICVPNAGAFDLVHKKWLTADCPEGANRRVHTPRDIFQCFSKEFFRFGSQKHERN